MKKIILFKIILYTSIFGLISFSLLFVIYIYYISQINKNSQNLANSFSVSYLYSNNSAYFTSEEFENNYTPFIIGIIKIDKIKLDYPILSDVSDELLKIAPCRFAGPSPNTVGNLCIAGHNYIDNTFFAKIRYLEIDDEISIYDLNGNLEKYYIFNKLEVDASDLSCTSQETLGNKIVTLMTCNSIKQTRIIIQAVAE